MWFDVPAAVGEAGAEVVEPYVYPLAADGQDGQQDEETEPEATCSDPAESPEGGTPLPAKGFSEEEVRTHEEQARALGVEEGEARARAKFEQELAANRETITSAVQDFARAKEEYFNRVEAVVVKLAVEIARKILHREVQMDPLLLAGVVRVALEKVSSGTTVRLRIHPDHVYAWHEFFANQPSSRPIPELLGDATLASGHCVLETALGTTDLALEAQLVEIERGFFDLLAQRPVTT